jgi:hypothetical protein
MRLLTKDVLSLLYISCELKGIPINEVLREILTQLNEEGNNLIHEIKDKMRF